MTKNEQRIRRMALFHDIPLLPEDPILGLPIAFAAENSPSKVNLGIGAYQNAEGNPLVLSCVKKAEQQIFQKNLNKEYLPIEGDNEFLKYSLRLLLGSDSPLLNSNLIFTAQTIGGTGALRVAGEFLAKLVTKMIFISQPTWPNHKLVFERAGMNIGSYPYFNAKDYSIDFSGMCEAIRNMPAGSVVLFHGCCHNPTGLDPSFEQWKELSDLVKQQQLIPFFDIAYQGFGKGIEEDAKAVRYFAEQGHEMLVAYSFAKNMGLYGERAGFLSVISKDEEMIKKISSQIKILIRGNYSTPPLHSARIVSTILKSHELKLEWEEELRNMRERVNEMRKALVAALLVKGTEKNFSYMYQQKGMFSFCGLETDQVQKLRRDWAIYMPNNGRINIAGLNTQNLEYVVDSILSVMKQ